MSSLNISESRISDHYSARPSTQNNDESATTSNVAATLQNGMLIALRNSHWVHLRAKLGLSLAPATGTKLSNLATTVTELSNIIKQAPAIPGAATTPNAVTLKDMKQAIISVMTVDQDNGVEEAANDDVDTAQGFCDELITEANENAKNVTDIFVGAIHPSIRQAQELLGKLHFLLDRDPNFFDKLKKLTTLEERKKEISEEFDKEMKAIKLYQDEVVASVQRFGITSPQAYTKTSLPKKLASILITSSGTFNVSIANAVEKALISGSQSPEYKEISRMLGLFTTDPSLQALLTAVKAPESETSNASELIAASCDVFGEDAIDDVDAKRCFLAAMLSPIQKIEDSCGYASYIAVMIKQMRPDRCAHDLLSIFSQDALVRTVDGTTTSIPVDLDLLEDKSLSVNVTVDKNGKVGKQYIKDLPGLQLAARQMKIADEDFDQKLKEALGRIGPGTTNVRRIILELANNNHELARYGRAAFSGISTNMLLHAWQHSISTLAQDRPKTMMHAKILHAVQATLYGQFTVKKLDPKDAAIYTQNNVHTFMKTVLEGIHNDIEDGQRKITFSQNRFVMNSITTAKEFQEFVVSHLTPEKLSVLGKDASESFAAKITQFVNTNEFLNEVYTHFDHSNATISNLNNTSKITYLPWSAPYGNDPVDSARVYFETDAAAISTFTPENPQNLLKQLLAFSKTQSQLKDNEASHFQLVTPQHTVSLLSDETSFKKHIENRANAEQCVKDYVASIKKVNFNAPVSDENRTMIISWFEQAMIPEGFSELSREFTAGVPLTDTMSESNADLVIPQGDVTIEQLREKLIGIAMFYQQAALPEGEMLPETYKAQATAMLDRYILKNALPSEVQQSIEALTIHFAEVPDASSQKAHLCFYPDPYNKGAISLGLVNADGSHLRQLTNDHWFTGKPWELYATKLTK